MDVQQYLEILREIKDVAFATIGEDGKPQVRIIDVMIVRDERLYFVTARGKEFHREIDENPHVAITGMTKEYLAVRLNGVVKKADPGWLDEVFDMNLAMNDVYPGDSRNILDVFYIEDGYGEVFDLGKHPIHRQSFVLGKGKLKPKGFEISAHCIGCGACKEH